MSKTIDEAKVVKAVEDILRRRGFAPRDADGSDWANPQASHTRFKVGCSYGEVTVSVWGPKQQKDVIRILNEGPSWEQAKRLLDNHLMQFHKVEA